MDKKYIAFLSYRHNELDKAVALRLQALLEGYRPPRSTGQRQKRIGRIFRDESELPTSGDLSADIKEALENSQYLIVICSEQTRQSHWCMDELRYFKQLHGGNNEKILTMLVHGEPHDVFPEELIYETRIDELPDGQKTERRLQVEPLCADVRAASLKKSLRRLRTEFLRIAAPMLGCSYDDLYRRDRRRNFRRFVAVSASVIAALSIFSIFISYQAVQINRQKEELEQANIEITDNLIKLQENQLFSALEYAKDLTQEGDHTQASAILMEAVDRFDTGSDRYDEFRLKLWPALADAAYCPKYSPYTSTKYFDSAVEHLALNSDETVFAASSGMKAGVWRVDNGELMYGLDTESAIVDLEIREGYLIAAEENGALLVCDLQTGKAEWEISNPREQEVDFYFTAAACNDSLNSIVMQVQYKAQGQDGWINELEFLPFPWLDEGKEPAFQFLQMPGNIVMSANGSYAACSVQDRTLMLDIGAYQADKSAQDNLRGMSAGSVMNTGDVYEIQITGNGLFYVRQQDPGAALDDYHCTFYDAVKKEAVFDFNTEGNFYNFYMDTVSDDRSDIIYECGSQLYRMDLGMFASLGTQPLTDEYVGGPLRIENSSILVFPMEGNAIAESDAYSLGLNDSPALGIEPVAVAVMSNDGSFILAGAKNGRVAVLSTEAALSNYINYCPEDFRYSSPIAISDSGSMLISSYSRAELYDVDTGSTGEPFTYSGETNIRLSADNASVFDVDYYNSLWFYDAKTGVVLLNRYKSIYTYYMDVSPDFKYMFELGYDDIFVYDTVTGNVLYTCPMKGEFRFGGVQNDGHTIWLMDPYGYLQTMDVVTGEVLSRMQLELEGGEVLSASVDPDNMLASVFSRRDEAGGSKYVTAVYSLEDGGCKFPLSDILDQDTFYWALSQNTRYAATSDYDNGVRSIAIPSYEDMLEDCRVMAAGRELTRDERRQCGLDAFDD